ncbi:MAG: DUF5668 domain-containing protein [Bacteroidota bacterium]
MQPSRSVIVGFLIVAIGLFLLADNMGFIPYELYFLRSWQMLLIVIGVFNFLTGRRSSAIVLFTIGLFFLIQDYGPYDFRDFWPVILVIIGVALILSRKSLGLSSKERNENYFDDVNIFGGGEKKFVSHHFEGGKVTNIFGGATIDLRDSIPVENAAIEVHTVFGGCEVIVPEDWIVKIEVFSLFGGFSDERRSAAPTPDSPHVVVQGFTIFGGGELKNS